MSIDKSGNLVIECKQIEEDSTYTAEVHYIIGSKLKKRSWWLKFIPPVVTLISALIVTFTGYDPLNWITLIGALASIGSTILEPEKESKEHIAAAKEFTSLKHEARSLHEAFSHYMSDTDFYHEVKSLRAKYNSLAKCTPPTDDEKAWNIARANIKSGTHKADFREDS